MGDGDLFSRLNVANKLSRVCADENNERLKISRVPEARFARDCLRIRHAIFAQTVDTIFVHRNWYDSIHRWLFCLRRCKNISRTTNPNKIRYRWYFSTRCYLSRSNGEKKKSQTHPFCRDGGTFPSFQKQTRVKRTTCVTRFSLFPSPSPSPSLFLDTVRNEKKTRLPAW